MEKSAGGKWEREGWTVGSCEQDATQNRWRMEGKTRQNEGKGKGVMYELCERVGSRYEQICRQEEENREAEIWSTDGWGVGRCE